MSTKTAVAEEYQEAVAKSKWPLKWHGMVKNGSRLTVF